MNKTAKTALIVGGIAFAAYLIYRKPQAQAPVEEEESPKEKKSLPSLGGGGGGGSSSGGVSPVPVAPTLAIPTSQVIVQTQPTTSTPSSTGTSSGSSTSGGGSTGTSITDTGAGATRDTGTASANVENAISNLETTLKNSWTTAIIKENPTNGTVTNLKNINYTYINYFYEIGNTNRNVAITSTTSVALTLNKNNTFNLTTTNVTYYAPVSPANNDIFRVQHLGSTGSFKVNVSATNSTVLVPLTTSVSAIKIYYFKYNSSNTTWELQTDLGYFPIPGTHLWNEPRTGLVSTYLPVPSKAIVSPSNSNIYYFYAPAYTNTDFSSSKVNAGLSIYTPILYTWDKSLTTSDAITILDTSITYPESDTWLTYANTHTEGYNKGTGYADPGTEFYYNHETECFDYAYTTIIQNLESEYYLKNVSYCKKLIKFLLCNKYEFKYLYIWWWDVFSFL